MPSRASCTDGSRNYLTIATRGQTLDTPSKRPPSAPLASFSPNRRRFWSTNAGCNTPKVTITPIPCWAWSRFPVTIRSAHCSIRSRRATLMRCLLRSLRALDGTTYFSSKAMHCHNCLPRQLTNGQTLYYHAAITPVIVCPGQSQGLALPPEYIMPQDGHAKQDCERAAG